MKKAASEVLSVAGRQVSISNATKVLFPGPKHTKLDVARYYVAVSEGALRGAGGRPNMLVRYPNGIDGEFFYQKRAPQARPPWIEVVSLQFPSGRSADEVVPRDSAALAWMANLACLELHPHPVRADDLEHPDELRVERRWSFDEVRRAALALAREVERRAPTIATSKWWKEERHGVFVDYNQNAKDRTVAAAYSVRPTGNATVSAPLTWEEVDSAEPADFTL